MTISRLLIANRGEIACRIARTAHDLGIGTVGVFSDEDARSRHVDAVDAAVALGGSSPAESYLRIDAVVDAARRTGCDAVHPGYGFLAENAEFAEAVLAAGLIWVGPTPDQIRLLGDKVAAKEAAVAAGVPTSATVAVVGGVPTGEVSFPALVKAAAGGGGRGMRVVRSPGELAEALAAASREAEAAFGDGTVFIEPFLERGRHIEVQIFGDTHGSVIHLGERDCSIQRRNQKVVEEAPAPGLHPSVRASLRSSAVAIGAHVGYIGAGTVEFLVEDDQIVFLEVNTRLQVEHPVTEAVTGLDLVALQLAVADGRPLPSTQDDVHLDGHAIEVRLVAERPAAGWVPSTGTLTDVVFDTAGTGVRVDAGFAAGDVVSPAYDSLLAKVIAHGPTREVAAARLARALRSSSVAGVSTNLATLTAIVEHPTFLTGATDIGFLDEHPEVATAAMPDGDDREALVVAAVVRRVLDARAQDRVTGFAPAGWRNLATTGARDRWTDLDLELDLGVETSVPPSHRHAADHRLAGISVIEVRLGAWPEPTDDGTLPADKRLARSVQIHEATDQHLAFSVDGIRRVCQTSTHADGSVTVRSRRGSATFAPIPRFVVPDAATTATGPVSPLPGTVLSVHVEVGQHVDAGDLLAVVEAMKMEHSIRATSPGAVAEVRFGVGDRVDAGDLLVVVQETED